MKAKVSGIKKPFGMQQKKDGSGTYGPAMLCEMELEDGQSAFVLVWKEVAIGDELELVKKGEFWNVISEKQQQQDDMSKVLNAMNTKLDKALRLLGELMGNDEALKAENPLEGLVEPEDEDL